MTRRYHSILASAALTATLGGCHAQQKAGHGEVSGQILPGSVSDAMLPYDTVKSKAPLAPREATSGGDEAGPDNAADSAETTAASADSTAPGVAASAGPAVPAQSSP